MRRIFEYKKFWLQIRQHEWPAYKNAVLVWKVKEGRHEHKWGVWLWDKDKILDYKKGPRPEAKFDTLMEARAYVLKNYEKEKYDKMKAKELADAHMEFDFGEQVNQPEPLEPYDNYLNHATPLVQLDNSPDSTNVVEDAVCPVVGPDDARTSEI